MKWHRDSRSYPHEILWRAAITTLRTAKGEGEKVRPDHLGVLALLSGFLAFEGFVNLVGDEVASDVWREEKKFFSQGNYRGLNGKLEFLFSQFPGHRLVKGQNPFQTFQKVRVFRDSIAHARVYKYTEITESEQAGLEVPWRHFDSLEEVERALGQLQLLAEELRVGALSILKEEYRLSHLHYPAFQGPIQTSTGEGVD